MSSGFGSEAVAVVFMHVFCIGMYIVFVRGL